ncbi:MAG TPA: GspE/PulE family protein [Methylomirabilota bacterium]|nr:GspE/PulE family protein [Methylomirabilota bacterium]
MSTDQQIPEVAPEQEPAAAAPERITVGLDSLQDTIARLAKQFENAPRRRATDHPPKRYTSKFEYLVEQQLISQQDLDAAIAEAKRAATHVDLILMQQYNISKAQIGQSSSVFYRVPFIEFDERLVISPDLVREIKVEYLKKNYWIPLRREGGAVVVLVDDPHDLAKVDSVERALKNQKVKLAVGFRSDILRFIAIASGEQAPRNPSATAESIQDIIGTLKAEDDGSSAAADGHDVAEVDENDSAIVRLSGQVILAAYQARASDIHIEPYGPQKDTIIRFRVDGSCQEYMKLPGAFRRPLVARIKIMSRLDIAERRKPQDGKIKIALPEREIELRVATIPTALGDEDVVMRILASNEPIPIDKLGMNERNLGEMKRISQRPYGLILCVGPTGSGKTTTLHSVLGFINKPDRKIWTAEDPVEITQYGLRQVQVNPKIGFNFAAAMRAFLRADPDVIMVGEMRDEETASVGIEASLTGHLVLSTLHTNSAPETVVRLVDMGCDPFNFSDAMLGILAQRLVKRICDGCKEPYQPTPEQFEEVVLAYGREEWETLGIKHDGGFKLYRGRGCDKCAKTGYTGRAAIHELLVTSAEIKRLIQTRARATEILTVAREGGMTTLLQDGISKALAGVTDVKQVKAVANA